MKNKYDFSGWATKNGLKCSDGRTIVKDAFKHNDGQTVPLVWNHQHNDPLNILGHAVLENREAGVYAYCTFNDTQAGKQAKELVEHGDVKALSIYANQLKQDREAHVLHGTIREVSLVLAGANPGAFIESVIKHGEACDDEGVIYTGEDISLEHACAPKKKKKQLEHIEDEDDKDEEMPDPDEEESTEDGEDGQNEDDADPKKKKKKEEGDDVKHSDGEGKTVQDVFNTLNEEQKTVVYALIGEALEDKKENNNKEDGGDSDMKHNVFDKETTNKDEVLTHAEMEAIIGDAKRYGSLKESALQHGIENIEYLFPEAKSLNTPPEFIKRDTGWVSKVMGGVHHTPFSRIKSMFADITEEDARAKGYMKGKLKKDEVFGLLKRTTDPQTVYKKQKLHRDDVIDITDFDVVAWLKGEMRMMLDEEIARAVLVGDGRLAASEDKIAETHIRPIWTDEELYTINVVLNFAKGADADTKAKAFIRGAIKARKNYKGSGEPNLFCSEDILTDCLLLEDLNGRVIYDSVQKLATALRVKEIITVPVMDGLNRTVDGAKRDLMGIIVNLKDYNIGADKGGAVNMFDDFDIDYNAQKYLIETRCSGALIKPFSAMVIEGVEASV